MTGRLLILLTFVIIASCSTSAQDNKRDKIKELLRLTHQDSLAIKKFSNISKPPEENYSEIFNDSSTLNLFSTYIKDTSLLNNMKTIMKDTAYMALIESFKSIYSAKEKTNQEEIKKIAIKFVNEGVVEIYDKKFSTDEINEMINFYKTNTGQKSLLLMPEIQDEVAKKVETIYISYMKEHSSR